MKITLIGPVYPYRGGIAHYTTSLAKALQANGHDVKVVSFRRQYPQWLYPGKSDRDPSHAALTVPASYLLDPLYPWTWWRTAAKIRQEHPDLVLFQWWTTFWSLAFTCLAHRLRANGVQVGFLIHNVIPHEPRPWDRLLAKMALGQGDAFLVQSSSQRDLLEKLIPGARIDLAEHPVYDLFSEQRMDRGEARQRLGVPEEFPLILFFGIVRPYKGLAVLVDAVGQLSAEGRPVGLYIAGEFWEDEQKYREQIQRLGLSDRVWIENRYIPNEELPVIFSAADVFAAPYTDATQSGAVKMAMGFGLPAAVTRPVVDESMQSMLDRRVFVCQAGDAPSLKESIQQAIQAQRADPIFDQSSQGWKFLTDHIQRIFSSPAAAAGPE